jgi:excisionase family DNA binding protein
MLNGAVLLPMRDRTYVSGSVPLLFQIQNKEDRGMNDGYDVFLCRRENSAFGNNEMNDQTIEPEKEVPEEDRFIQLLKRKMEECGAEEGLTIEQTEERMLTKDCLLTPRDVAWFLQIPVLEVKDLLRKGKLSGQRFGKAWRIHRDNLIKYLDQSREK